MRLYDVVNIVTHENALVKRVLRKKSHLSNISHFFFEKMGNMQKEAIITKNHRLKIGDFCFIIVYFAFVSQ